MIIRRVPGIALCFAITLLANSIQSVEQYAFGHPYVEAIVIAILVGMAIRTAWEPGPSWRPGVAFSAKQLLEVAVVLLGASISVSAIAAVGPLLFCAVIATVVLALGFTFVICR